MPLVFPELYALGPTEIQYSQSQKFTEARSWYVANDPPGNTVECKNTPSSTTTTNCTLNIPAGTTMILVNVVTGGTPTHNTPTSNRTGTTFTLLSNQAVTSGAKISNSVFRSTAIVTGSQIITATVGTSAPLSLIVVAYSGSLTTAPTVLGSSGIGKATTTTSVETGTLTIGSRHILFEGADQSNTWTPAAGTERLDTGGSGVAVQASVLSRNTTTTSSTLTTNQDSPSG
ncbi:MAG: hypothetical protein ACE5R7_06265, partial [Nitrosarchaeum sp.]